MAAGRQTFINYMLEYLGFENVVRDARYPEVDLNEDWYENVDVILLSSEPYPFKTKHIEELAPKFPNTQILLVDGEMFSWYGSRLLAAGTYFNGLELNIKP